jgi:hypothetical protein
LNWSCVVEGLLNDIGGGGYVLVLPNMCQRHTSAASPLFLVLVRFDDCSWRFLKGTHDSINQVISQNGMQTLARLTFRN